MKYTVLQKFRDKITRELYEIGAEYTTESKERALYLQQSGFLGAEIIEEPVKESLVTDNQIDDKPKQKGRRKAAEAASGESDESREAE